LEGDRQTGVDLVMKALEEPIRMIAENAGVEGSVVVEKVKGEKAAFGYDADKLEYSDNMYESGIIDPTKVVRLALQNAASVASLLITTEAVIAEKPKKEPAFAPPPPAY